MTVAPEQKRWFVCWGISILVHAVMLVFGAILLIKAARFQVEAGETSMEINLITAPGPVATIKPQMPSSPTPPLPANASVPIYKSEPLAEPPVPKTRPAIPSPSTTPVLAPVANPPIKSKATSAHPASSVSQGAISAQPDDLQNEPPVYPEESRVAREQGVVILLVEVTASGEPAGISILKSSGYFRLDQAARRAVHIGGFIQP